MSLSLTRQNLAPTYEQLADAFSHAKDKVIIAKVDADGAGRPLGQKYDVTGYPSKPIHVFGRVLIRRLIRPLAIKWFDGQGNAEAYEGGRDLDTLASLCGVHGHVVHHCLTANIQCIPKSWCQVKY